MSNLKIRLDVYNLNNAPKEFGVVTNIYSLPSKERTMEISKEKRRELQNILIPAGPPWESPLEFQTVALPAGRYYVEAILPSNEVVGDEVQITVIPHPKS